MFTISNCTYLFNMMFPAFLSKFTKSTIIKITFWMVISGIEKAFWHFRSEPFFCVHLKGKKQNAQTYSLVAPYLFILSKTKQKFIKKMIRTKSSFFLKTCQSSNKCLLFRSLSKSWRIKGVKLRYGVPRLVIPDHTPKKTT